MPMMMELPTVTVRQKKEVATVINLENDNSKPLNEKTMSVPLRASHALQQQVQVGARCARCMLATCLSKESGLCPQ